MKHVFALLQAVCLSLAITMGQVPDKGLNGIPAKHNLQDLFIIPVVPETDIYQLESSDKSAGMENSMQGIINYPVRKIPENKNQRKIQEASTAGDIHASSISRRTGSANHSLKGINQKKSGELNPGHTLAGYQSRLTFLKDISNAVKDLKTGQGEKMRLDSAIFINYINGSHEIDWSHKSVFTYNENNKVYSEDYYERGGNDDNWSIFDRIEYTFDESNYISQGIEFRWDETAGQLVPFWKEEFTWDTYGNITQCLDYSWDKEMGNWVNKWKEVCYIDTSGAVTQSISYSWSNSLDNWENSVKEEYTNDYKGNTIRMLSYSWDITNSDWSIWSKEESIYNTSDNKLQFLASTWWENSEAYWMDHTKIEYQYDYDGNLAATLFYEEEYGDCPLLINQRMVQYDYDNEGRKLLDCGFRWNADSLLWVGYTRYEQIFNSEGKLMQRIDFSWDSTSNNWIFLTKGEQTIDASGNPEIYYMYNWDKLLNQWEISFKYDDLVFDENKNLILYTRYDWDPVEGLWRENEKYENNFYLPGLMSSRTILKWDKALNQWIFNAKWEYIYDDSDRVVQYASWNWNTELNNWIGDSKSEYIYDSFGNQTKNARYNWNYDLNDWDCNSLYERVFNDSGDIISYVYSGWDQMLNKLSSLYKTEYTYNDSGKLTSRINYFWDTDLNNWIGSNKLENTYDDSGNFISMSYKWNAEISGWEISSKKEVFNNDAGQVNTEIGYSWDKNQNQWINPYKTEYTYNTDENGSYYYIGYYWITQTEQWHESSKTEYQYNSAGLILKKLAFTFSEEGNWEMVSKDESIYDPDGNLVLNTMAAWDSKSYTFNSLELHEKREYSYNKNYSITDLVLPEGFFDLKDSKYMPVEHKYYYWDPDNEIWWQNKLATFYYSNTDIGSGLEGNDVPQFLLYPVPASDYVMIKSSLKEQIYFEVYDVNGSKLISKYVNDKQPIPVNQLGSGIYFYRVSSVGNTQRGKFIKR